VSMGAFYGVPPRRAWPARRPTTPFGYATVYVFLPPASRLRATLAMLVALVACASSFSML